MIHHSGTLAVCTLSWKAHLPRCHIEIPLVGPSTQPVVLGSSGTRLLFHKKQKETLGHRVRLLSTLFFPYPAPLASFSYLPFLFAFPSSHFFCYPSSPLLFLRGDAFTPRLVCNLEGFEPPARAVASWSRAQSASMCEIASARDSSTGAPAAKNYCDGQLAQTGSRLAVHGGDRGWKWGSHRWPCTWRPRECLAAGSGGCSTRGR